VGHIRYKDGKENKIVVPVEPTGIVGLRAGSSALAKYDPRENTQETRLMRMILEIEGILLRTLRIVKRSEPKIAMINGYFNVLTDKTGKNRPRVSNFVKMLRDLYNGSETLKEKYNKPSMPWMDVQGGPSVMKASFKPKLALETKGARRDANSLPTFTVSPFGHIELMGAKSFRSIRDAYIIILDAFGNLNVSFQEKNNNNDIEVTKKRTKKEINFSKYGSISFSKKDNRLFINKKPCSSYPKGFVTRLAIANGVPSRGKISTVCDRLFKVPDVKHNFPAPKSMTLKKNKKGSHLTIHGKRCSSISKKELLEKYADRFGLSPRMTVKDICETIHKASFQNSKTPSKASSKASSKNSNSVKTPNESFLGSLMNGNSKTPSSKASSKNNNSVKTPNESFLGSLLNGNSKIPSSKASSKRSPPWVYLARSPTPTMNNNNILNKEENEKGKKVFVKDQQVRNYFKKHGIVSPVSENHLSEMVANHWDRNLSTENKRRWIPAEASASSKASSKNSNSVKTPNESFLGSLLNGNSKTPSKASSKASSKNSNSVKTPNESFLGSLLNGNSKTPSKASSKASSKNSNSVKTPNESFLGSLLNGNSKTPSSKVPRVVRRCDYYIEEPNRETIKRVLCTRKSLAELRSLAETAEIAGAKAMTKSALCEQLGLFENDKGRKYLIEKQIVPGKRVACDNKSLTFLKEFARARGVTDLSGTKRELCKKIKKL
jgi:hypothetical protein